MSEGARPASGGQWALARRLAGYLRWQWIAFAVILSALVGVTTQAFPYLQRILVDRYLAPRAGSAFADLSLEERLSGADAFTLLYLAVALFAFAAQYAFAMFVSWMGQRTLHRMRYDLFSKLHRLPVAYFDRRSVGQLVTRIVSDVDGINRFVTLGLVSIAQSVLILLAVAGYMLFLDWRLALVAMTTVPALYFVIQFFGSRTQRVFARLREQQGRINGAVHEFLSGMTTVQLHNQEPLARSEVEAMNRDLHEGERAVHWWSSAAPPLVDLITSFTLAAVLWYGGGLSVQGALSLGTLVAFTQYLRNFFAPLQELSQISNALPAAVTSAVRIFEVLDEPETVADLPDAKPLSALKGEVEFEDVWFSYRDRALPARAGGAEWVLKGVSFRAKPGESIALVGATGAGKSTIINLLMRFYDAERGAVRVDGGDVRSYRQRDLRKHIGLVLQEALLFHGTIESNLRMGNEDVAFERLVQVCQLIGIHDFIAALPDGYQTVVSERGANFSTGQKQLLSFARSVIPDPQLLLLDEATASVDSHSEAQIQRALGALMSGRTSIVIAHRLSTVQHCDRILVMREGEVVEAGTHQALLQAGGYYARLHALHALRHPGEAG